MFLYGLNSLRGSFPAASILYFSKGRQIFQTVEEVAQHHFGGLDRVRSFFDFASGFGRSTRFLSRALGPERITVAEIDPRAVQFQQETFGVRGVVSGLEPDTLSVSEDFDLVVASSFFSHLPGRSFRGWLTRLYELVAPGGALLFSTHGRNLMPAREADWSSGIVFVPQSETLRLDASEYGTSYVTEEFVRAAAHGAAAEADFAAFPFGFCAQQDLYVLSKPPLRRGPALKVSRFPRGELDRFEIGEGPRVLVAGWVSSGVGRPVPTVRLLIEEDPVLTVRPAEQPPSESRWEFSFDRSRIGPDDVIRVEAESARGLSNILAMGTLRPHLPPDALPSSE
jgi:SAM-dependent methyltransferase